MSKYTEVLGVEIDTQHIADDDVVLEVIFVAKVLDGDGRTRLVQSHTEGVRSWEALGMLRSVEVDIEMDMRRSWEQE